MKTCNMKTRQTLVCGVFALVLMLAGTGMVFAQEGTASGEKKNSITLDMIPLFKGFIASDADDDTFFFCMALAYERLVAPRFSIGAEIDLYPGELHTISYMYFGLAAAGRYYPMSEQMEKFFLGANLGFNVQAIDGETDSAHGGFFGLTIGLKAGYRLLLGKTFFFEPSMSYTYSKSGSLSMFGGTPSNLGWQAGLRLGVSF